jgi:hypothetical protein
MNTLDMLAIIIALGSSLALIATTAVQNARLTRSRDQWRTDCHQARADYHDLIAKHAECPAITGEW